MFALVDGNNFYVSCERVFQPALTGVPVAVLSNNDGCVISRSAEVKALGVSIGTPFHEIRPLIRDHGVRVFSSNYALYGDMSRRVVQVLQQFTPDVEIYSIDESFLSFDRLPDAQALGGDIRERVLRWTGIPTCVGFGPSKTLAKLANVIAKRTPELEGVCDLSDPAEREARFSGLPVSMVWGIGRRLAARLEPLGIRTVPELLAADPRALRSLMTVVGERILRELRGVPCLPLEMLPARRKGAACTRSFGYPVRDWQEMAEAVSAYASRLAEKLRAENLLTENLTVGLETSRNRTDQPFYRASRTLVLPEATSDSRHLVAAARALAHSLWREGLAYKKAGVWASDLLTADQVQPGLFAASADKNGTADGRQKKLMQAMDGLNRRFGLEKVRVASSGLERGWSMRRDFMSPRYTTDWADLLTVS